MSAHLNNLKQAKTMPIYLHLTPEMRISDQKLPYSNFCLVYICVSQRNAEHTKKLNETKTNEKEQYVCQIEISQV